MTAFLSVLYICSVAAANLLVNKYGPSSVFLVAFVFIGFDLTIRDKLHEKISEHTMLKLASLILSGSLLTYFLNQGAQKIALASAVAFLSAGLVDMLVYQWRKLRGDTWLSRSNKSNCAAAVVDSVVFLSLAFGWVPWIMLGQIVVKVWGGALWALGLEITGKRVEHEKRNKGAVNG